MTENATAEADPPHPTAADPVQAKSLKSQVLRGATWTSIGFAVAFVLRFASQLVLTRLLSPYVYGVAGLIWMFMTGLQMFSDLGFVPNIIRSERGNDRDFLDTAWTLQVARGLALWAMAAALAWPAAVFYRQPDLRLLLAVAGLSAAMQGFYSTAMATCTRHLHVKRLVLLEMTAHIVSFVTTLSIAYVWRSVWPLVLGTLAGYLVRMVLSHLVLGGHRHRFHWEPHAARELFTFGRWVFLSSMLGFLAMQSDRLVLGKLIGIQEFGLYSIAMMLATVPRDLFERISSQIMLPVLVRVLRQEGGAARSASVRMVMLAFAALGCAALIATAQPLVDFLFDPRYHGAGAYLMVLTVGAWMASITSSYVSLLMSAAHPSPNRYIALGVTLRVLLFFTLLYPAWKLYGALGVAGLASLSEIGAQAGCIYGVRSLGLTSLRVDLPMHGLLALSTALFMLVHRTAAALSGSPLFGLAAVGVVVGAIGLSGLYVLRHRPGCFSLVQATETP